MDILKEAEILGQKYYETIYSVLTEEELAQFVQIQRKLLYHIKQYTKEPPYSVSNE